MKCPFCYKQMQEGFVSGKESQFDPNRLYWEYYEARERSDISKLLTNEQTKLVRRTKNIHLDNELNFFHERATAYYCPDCKKIIMDTYVEED